MYLIDYVFPFQATSKYSYLTLKNQILRKDSTVNTIRLLGECCGSFFECIVGFCFYIELSRLFTHPSFIVVQLVNVQGVPLPILRV